MTSYSTEQAEASGVLAGVATTPVLRQECRKAVKWQIGSQAELFEKENEYGVMLVDKTQGDFKHCLRSCQAVSFLFHLESNNTNIKILYRPKSSNLF